MEGSPKTHKGPGWFSSKRLSIRCLFVALPLLAILVLNAITIIMFLATTAASVNRLADENSRTVDVLMAETRTSVSGLLTSTVGLLEGQLGQAQQTIANLSRLTEQGIDAYYAQTVKQQMQANHRLVARALLSVMDQAYIATDQEQEQ
eukprot:TRINITY_DN13378_c0_g1_i3.p2 TRINITY_DN13378_c0_g1~~TRINITY_DN13378_c0_g1_i3.p2  ORF type:complete len:148 (+),score=30.07 TRINITY_DN13378_c0_g1_i3:347-790(+)